MRDHVDRFGGDPGRVTIFGQSAGAMSVASLLGAPSARPLFHRAVCMSGAADHVLETGEAEQVATIFLRALGGPPPSLEALGRLPIERILQAQHETMAGLVDMRRIMVFLPAVDGDLIPEQPIDALRGGAAADIPIMTGTTLDEWRLFRLVDEGIASFGWGDLVGRFEHVLGDFARAPAAGEAARSFHEALGVRSASRRPSDVWSAFQTARVFYRPSTRLAEAQHEGGGDAFSYLFVWRPPAARRALGACHAIDIPFVFGATAHPLARPLTGITAVSARLARNMQHAWDRFAREGAPGHARLPAWPRYDAERRPTMVFGRRTALSDAPLEAERALLTHWSGPDSPRPALSRAAAW